MSARRSLVYFAYLGDGEETDELLDRRLGFMDSQLRWLSDLIATSGRRIEVLVPYVAPRAWDERVHHAVTRLGFAVDPECVTAERRNTFEFPGFRALKRLAGQADAEELILYCHSKGIVQLSQGKMGIFRMHSDVLLRADLSPMERDGRLTRAGLFPSRPGWCWFNFFWVKAGYMAGRRVEEAEDRYHFEALIGDAADREGYRGVLGLSGDLSPEATGLPVRPWYRPTEFSTEALERTYRRYAAMASPAESATMRAGRQEGR